MNTAEMINQLGPRWRDPTNQVVARATSTGGKPNWLAYLNKAQRRFIKRTRFSIPREYSNLAFDVGEKSRPLPAGVTWVFSAYNDTAQHPLNWIAFRDQQEAIWGRGEEPGDFTHFNIEGAVLYAFSPPIRATTVSILHPGVVPDLADDGSSVSVVPEHYHHALLDGAMEFAFRDDQQHELAQAYSRDFNEAVAEALAEFAKPRGGKNVPFRNDYFDTGNNPAAIRGMR